jgi:surfactin synthase thioesterase subunit
MFSGDHFFLESAQEAVLQTVAATIQRSLRGNFGESG